MEDGPKQCHGDMLGWVLDLLNRENVYLYLTRGFYLMLPIRCVEGQPYPLTIVMSKHTAAPQNKLK